MSYRSAKAVAAATVRRRRPGILQVVAVGDRRFVLVPVVEPRVVLFQHPTAPGRRRGGTRRARDSRIRVPTSSRPAVGLRASGCGQQRRPWLSRLVATGGRSRRRGTSVCRSRTPRTSAPTPMSSSSSPVRSSRRQRIRPRRERRGFSARIGSQLVLGELAELVGHGECTSTARRPRSRPRSGRNGGGRRRSSGRPPSAPRRSASPVARPRRAAIGSSSCSTGWSTRFDTEMASNEI